MAGIYHNHPQPKTCIYQLLILDVMTLQKWCQPCALCKLESPKKLCRIQGTSYVMASVVGSRVAGSLLLGEKSIGLSDHLDYIL